METKTFLFLAFLTFLLIACAAPFTATPTPTLSPSLTEIDAPSCPDPFGGVRINFIKSYWLKTDFCKHSAPYDEFVSPNVSPDGIPPIDNPAFNTIQEADEWLAPTEPVIALEVNGVARAYPLEIIIYHEVVNDEVGGVPVAVTYCPLIDGAIVFDRRVGEQVLRLGVSGNLRKSALVMWDRQTESWWQQITGKGVVGYYTGTELDFLPMAILPWVEFKNAYPTGKVLSKDTGASYEYGTNTSIFVGYDDINKTPFFFKEPIDQRLPAMARVATVKIGDVNKAYPFELLAQVGVLNDTAAEQKLVVFWQAGTNSAVDNEVIKNSRDIGASAIFDRTIDGQELTFVLDGNLFRDEQTGTKWTLWGKAVEGPLTGQSLNHLIHHQFFWFAWSTFNPDGEVYSD